MTTVLHSPNKRAHDKKSSSSSAGSKPGAGGPVQERLGRNVACGRAPADGTSLGVSAVFFVEFLTSTAGRNFRERFLLVFSDFSLVNLIQLACPFVILNLFCVCIAPLQNGSSYLQCYDHFRFEFTVYKNRKEQSQFSALLGTTGVHLGPRCPRTHVVGAASSFAES